MVKIIRYEVYSDKGDGWMLVEQFGGEDRQNASFLARDIEETGIPVKLIREVYDTDDGSFQETVEYIGALKKKAKSKVVSVEDALFDDLKGEYNIEATPFKMLAENQVSKAIVKLCLIIGFSLLLANILISLSIPLVEFWAPEEKRKSVLFFGFFIIFISISGPLLFYKIPWNVFYSLHKDDKEIINEKIFFRRAANLMGKYNLNDNGKEVIVPVFPQAPLEYKQYIIEYLSQVLNNLDSNIRIGDSFHRLGIELMTYGASLELAKYGRLGWAEANSLLYEAFKILEGDKVDLQAFYDAKRTYQDNKVAVFLTGVGAYLVSQVIHNIPMDASVLKITMQKWIDFKVPSDIPIVEKNQPVEDKKIPVKTGSGRVFECLLNMRVNVHMFDDEKEIGEEEQNAVNADIRGIIAELKDKYNGGDVIEESNVTSIHFSNLGKAAQCAVEVFSALEDYKDKHTEYNLIMDAKAALLEVASNKTLNLSSYISDILEYAYNQEIIVNGVVKDELLESSYGFEFLGDKKLSRSGVTQPLYKMTF